MTKNKLIKKIGEILIERDSTEMAFRIASGSKFSYSKLTQH